MYDRGSEGVPSQKAQGLSVSRCLRVFVLQTLYAHPGGREQRACRLDCWLAGQAQAAVESSHHQL